METTPPTHPAAPAAPAVDPAPFLRWAGGKRRKLPVLTAVLPAFDGYFEPFFGGGALLFDLATRGLVDRATINDLNPALVALYRTLAADPDALFAHARPEVAAFERLTGDARPAAFYAWRERFNQLVVDADGSADAELATLMLLLNRTCFNGLWRVNSSGRYNVPWGKLKNPTLLDEPLLRAVAGVLGRTEVLCGEYGRATRAATAGDLVYFDPPYIPHNPTSSFSRYTPDDFGRRDQFTLAGLVRGLVADGVHVMLSNADDTDGLARRIFGDCAAEGHGFYLLSTSVKRSISAKASSRGGVGEVLGVSWGPDQATDLPALRELGVTLICGTGPHAEEWATALG